MDLVTLSACETERGRLSQGEGVQAFGRALLAAGAASAVTTLWRVTDQTTAAFMEMYYSRLAAGQSKVEALRDTKAAFLDSASEQSHPYYWAAYVLWGGGHESLPVALAGPRLWLSIAFILAVMGCLSHGFRRWLGTRSRRPV